MVQEAKVVERLLLQVHARTGLPEHFRALQGIDAVAEARLGAGVDMPDTVGVIDVETFRRQGGVDARRDRSEDVFIGTAGGQPKVGAVLRHGHRLAAGGDEEPGQGQGEILTHIVVCDYFTGIIRFPPRTSGGRP